MHMKRLLAAALTIFAASTYSASAQDSANPQDKTRAKPGPYPTKFQISGNQDGPANAFLLDENARLFYCVSVNTFTCGAPFQLPQTTSGTVINPAGQLIEYFMATTHKGGFQIMIVSSFGTVYHCHLVYGTTTIAWSSVPLP
jgi:hypothetical protein